MHAVLVTCGREERIILSTKINIENILKKFLEDAYGVKNFDIEYSSKDKVFTAGSYSGEFRLICISTC